MNIPRAWFQANCSINILESALITTIKQIKQSLCQGAFNPSRWLELLYFAAGHVDDTVRTKREISLCQSQVYHRVIWFKLCCLRISDSCFAPLTLCQSLFSTLHIRLNIRLCF